MRNFLFNARTYLWTQERINVIFICLMFAVGTCQHIPNKGIMVGETRLNQGKDKLGIYIGGF